MIPGHVELNRHSRVQVSAAAFVALTILSFVVVLSTPVRSDSPSYYAFADQRTFLGIPNFMNVISNVPWAFIGIAGVLFAWRRKAGPDGPFSEPWERNATIVLFAAVLGVSIGSSYFHYAPGVPTLLWDRLPMSVIFMSVFSLMIGDRLGLRVGRILFWPFVGFGIFSVVYWRYTEMLGRGDFRLYILAQFFPLLAIPLLLAAFPARYSGTGGMWLSLGSYGLAKLFELSDRPIFELTKGVSGHTLKHLAAAATTLLLLRVYRLRRRIHESAR